MMSIVEYQAMFKKILPPEVVFAGQYLEYRGLRFGAEFGTSNAIRKATDRILAAIEESEHYGHAV